MAARQIARQIMAPLNELELQDRLTLNSPELVRELYDVAQQRVAAEVGRQTRLDTKATSLLTAAGLSLTVAFTFGSTLISRPEPFEHWHWWVIGAFAGAIVLGLSAAILAVRTLLVRGQYLMVNERAVLDFAILDDANDPVALRDDDEMEDTDKRMFGVMEFQKHMIVQLWMVAQRHQRNHTAKSNLIKIGQWFFLGFLAALLVVCIFIVLGASSSHAARPSSVATVLVLAQASS